MVTLPVALPNPNIALSPPYPAAARVSLTVPTPVVSVATTPALDTRLIIGAIGTGPGKLPNPNIALSPPYPAAARFSLAVPTPVVSVATTPVLDTLLVIDVTVVTS